MLALLAALIPLLGGFTQPIKDFFLAKQQTAQKREEYKISSLNAQIELLRTNTQAVKDELIARLNCTSQEFKQNTFWFLCVPIIITMLFPSFAKTMWTNFAIIPEAFQYLFISVYSSIWGIPLAKDGFNVVDSILATRRQYKLDKETIKATSVLSVNEDKLAQALRDRLFHNGMSQQQWEGVRDSVLASIEQKGE